MKGAGATRGAAAGVCRRRRCAAVRLARRPDDGVLGASPFQVAALGLTGLEARTEHSFLERGRHIGLHHTLNYICIFMCLDHISVSEFFLEEHGAVGDARDLNILRKHLCFN